MLGVGLQLGYGDIKHLDSGFFYAGQRVRETSVYGLKAGAVLECIYSCQGGG